MFEPRNRYRPSIVYTQPAKNLCDHSFPEGDHHLSKKMMQVARKLDFSFHVSPELLDFSSASKEKKGFQTFIIRDSKIQEVSCSLSQQESSQVTVEWLFNEYSRWRMATVGDDISLIACLTTADTNINYDSLLTKPFVELSVFPHSITLEPYYMEHVDRLDFKAFKVLRIVGSGAYSKVAVARRRDTGIIYAMKILNKAHYASIRKEPYLLREEMILKTIDHPHLVFSFN